MQEESSPHDGFRISRDAGETAPTALAKVVIGFGSPTSRSGGDAMEASTASMDGAVAACLTFVEVSNPLMMGQADLFSIRRFGVAQTIGRNAEIARP